MKEGGRLGRKKGVNRSEREDKGGERERREQEEEEKKGKGHTFVETRSPMVFRNFHVLSILTFGVPQVGSNEEARASSLSIAG